MPNELEQLPEDGEEDALRQENTAHVGANSKGSCRPLTRDLVIQISLKTNQRLRTATDHAAEAKALAKQTHLHLNGLHLNQVGAGSLHGFKGLETLYLYDNGLSCVEGLEQLPELTHLYLQDNVLTQLSGLGALTGLQKLYLQGNYLHEIRGLDNCLCLEELHVSGQHLAPDQHLVFAPGSLAAVASSLRVLTASDCNIQDDSLAGLGSLEELVRLDLGGNQLSSLEALEGMLQGLPRLVSLTLKGNPVARAPKYAESVIVMTGQLQVLDDLPIKQQQREALLRLQIKRMRSAIATDHAQLAGYDGAAQAMDPQQSPAARQPAGLHGRSAGAAAASRVMGRAKPSAPPTTAGFGQPRARGAASNAWPQHDRGDAAGINPDELALTMTGMGMGGSSGHPVGQRYVGR